jgi:DNA modification methylase
MSFLSDYVFPGVHAQGQRWTSTGKRVWMERSKPILWYERRAPKTTGARGRHPWKRFPGGTDRIVVECEAALDFDQARYPDQQSLTGFRAILGMYTTPSDVIMDPCMGWGTTLRAALSVDRKRVIGIEKDGVRYQHATKQLGLAPVHASATHEAAD